jgi:hypothetical protein
MPGIARHEPAILDRPRKVGRATDTKLGRDVAIKILSEAFTSDADRMARFQREAQVLAAPHHRARRSAHAPL